MLLCREATAEREKRCCKSHILDPDPSFGVRRSVIYIFNLSIYRGELIYLYLYRGAPSSNQVVSLLIGFAALMG